MISNKHITKTVAVIMAAAVCLCILCAVFADRLSSSQSGVSMEYESELFDTSSIIDLNIIMDESDWNDMLENAIDEEYYSCDVEINGKTFYNVGIRTKGNTSLSSIASDPTTDRYSLKLEFDHYIDGQTCYGLDKLVLNNNYADATNMKEALIYDMFAYMDADASLYNYAKISVNGDYWGVYLALEAVEDSFLLRNYGAQSGSLYKPEGVNNVGGAPDNNFGANTEANKNFANPDSQNEPPAKPDSETMSAPTQNGELPSENSNVQPDMPDQMPDQMSEQTSEQMQGQMTEQMPEQMTEQMPEQMTEQRTNTSFSTAGGADLNYIDDDEDSYSVIWDGEITSSSSSDRKKVIEALKNISEGTNVESYADVDNILRYMAVHVFSVNDDSLSGNMAHNYYLYESKGKLNIIPWDYNLAFGGMGQNASASSVINSAIDDSFGSTDFFDVFLQDEEFSSVYHEYLRTLAKDYVESGKFDEFYERTRSLIDELVKEDPNAFYSYEEYEEAAETLYSVVKLRAESVIGQIEGSIPSVSEEQKASSSLIDASGINISVMGVMNGGDKNNNEQNTPAFGEFTGEEFTNESSAADENAQQPSSENSGVNNNMQQPSSENSSEGENMQIQQPPSGNFGENENMQQFENGEAPSNAPQPPNGFSENTPPDQQQGQSDSLPAKEQDSSSRASSDESTGISTGTLLTYAISFAVLALCAVLAMRFRKK